MAIFEDLAGNAYDAQKNLLRLSGLLTAARQIPCEFVRASKHPPGRLILHKQSEAIGQIQSPSKGIKLQSQTSYAEQRVKSVNTLYSVFSKQSSAGIFVYFPRPVELHALYFTRLATLSDLLT